MDMSLFSELFYVNGIICILVALAVFHQSYDLDINQVCMYNSTLFFVIARPVLFNRSF